MLSGPGIIEACKRETQLKVKHLQFNYCSKFGYGLVVKSIGQVFALKMQVIFMIPAKFYMKTCQFI